MKPEWERYDRQMKVAGMGPEGQEKLSRASVLVVGAGGLGCPVLLYLTGAGVGTIGIADADTVSVSNLHRQLLHPEANVGLNKAESAAAQLRQLNSRVRFRTYPYRITEENAREILADYDFVVICVDNFQARFAINDACVALKKPFCNGGVLELHGQVMTYVPGKGPCYRCIFEEVPAPGTVPTAAEVGVLGPACGIIGSLQAAEAVKYLTGVGTLLTGKLLTLDAATLETRVIPFPKASPTCKACGGK